MMTNIKSVSTLSYDLMLALVAKRLGGDSSKQAQVARKLLQKQPDALMRSGKNYQANQLVQDLHAIVEGQKGDKRISAALTSYAQTILEAATLGVSPVAMVAASASAAAHQAPGTESDAQLEQADIEAVNEMTQLLMERAAAANASNPSRASATQDAGKAGVSSDDLLAAFHAEFGETPAEVVGDSSVRIPLNGMLVTFSLRADKRNRPVWIFAGEEKPGVADVVGLEIRQDMKFGDVSREQLMEFVRSHDLDAILELYGSNPGILVQALRLLRGEAFKGRDVVEFVKAYVGLEVKRPGSVQGAGNGKEEGRWKFIEALLKALQQEEKLDLDEAVRLLQRLSQKEFQKDPEALIADLRKRAKNFEAAQLEFTKDPDQARDFLVKLHQRTADHFAKVLGFEVKHMRTHLFPYQREGAQFLAARTGAILADEAGMGKSCQAIAAAESMGARRVLWITTAANKATIRDEILEHSNVTDDQIKIVASGDPVKRKAEIDQLNGERYVIVNYELLREVRRSDPAGYQKLTHDVDVLVVDEAQLTDNPNTLRSGAVAEIQAGHRWLLTATPYQNRVDGLWALLNCIQPEEFQSRRAFRELYTGNTAGLLLLHSKLDEFMLRRTKHDTMRYFESPAIRSFERQLADGASRIPKKVRSEPETYSLLPEQADLIAWMVADFPDWAMDHNRHLRPGETPIDLGAINAPMKFDWLHKVIYEPESFGIKAENPLWSALDRQVSQARAKGEKIILWSFNTGLIDQIETRYGQHGLRRIDGPSNVGTNREDAKRDFQNDPAVTILDANYLSGGVGLTLTAGDRAIFVQLPLTYPQVYQAEGRHQRLIGLRNVAHAKETVYTEWLVPAFPEGFVESISDPQLRETLEHGTLVEQTLRRSRGGELLYNLVMEGYGDADDLQTYFMSKVFDGMGLTRRETLEYASAASGKTRAMLAMAEMFLPLWNRAQDPAQKEKLLQIVDEMRFYPDDAKRMVGALSTSDRVDTEDLDFVAGLLDIRNKYIREQLLRKVPDVMERLYPQGTSIAQASRNIHLDTLTPHSFVAQLALQEQAFPLIRDLASGLDALRDSPEKRAMQEKFHHGVFGIVGNAPAQTLLRQNLRVLSGASLSERMDAVYRLGLLARTHPEAIQDVTRFAYTDARGLLQAIDRGMVSAVAKFAGVSSGDVAATLLNHPEWQQSADSILALQAGWEALGDQKLLGQYHEALHAIFSGRYAGWRYGSGSHDAGSSISYLSDNARFWDIFSQNGKTAVAVMYNARSADQSLADEYHSLRAEVDRLRGAVEGEFVYEKLVEYRKAKPAEQQQFFIKYTRDLEGFGRALGTLYGQSGEQASEFVSGIMSQYGLPGEVDLANRNKLISKKTELESLLGWITLDQAFGSLEHGGETPEIRSIASDKVQEALARKERLYRRENQDVIGDAFEAMGNTVRLRKGADGSLKHVTIEETDDPAVLVRMGALTPNLTNCFNPNGNPGFNQYVVCALGSKNMKLLVAKDDKGNILGSAMAKVKQLEDGTPVLFLERGLFSGAHNFRKEMLAFLATKAEALKASGVEPVVMNQVYGKSRPEDREVYGTGAFTENEYVEPVFSLRRSAKIHHRGRLTE